MAAISSAVAKLVGKRDWRNAGLDEADKNKGLLNPSKRSRLSKSSESSVSSKTLLDDRENANFESSDRASQSDLSLQANEIETNLNAAHDDLDREKLRRCVEAVGVIMGIKNPLQRILELARQDEKPHDDWEGEGNREEFGDDTSDMAGKQSINKFLEVNSEGSADRSFEEFGSSNSERVESTSGSSASEDKSRSRDDAEVESDESSSSSGSSSLEELRSNQLRSMKQKILSFGKTSSTSSSTSSSASDTSSDAGEVSIPRASENSKRRKVPSTRNFLNRSKSHLLKARLDSFVPQMQASYEEMLESRRSSRRGSRSESNIIQEVDEREEKQNNDTSVEEIESDIEEDFAERFECSHQRESEELGDDPWPAVTPAKKGKKAKIEEVE